MCTMVRQISLSHKVNKVITMRIFNKVFQEERKHLFEVSDFSQ